MFKRALYILFLPFCVFASIPLLFLYSAPKQNSIMTSAFPARNILMRSSNCKMSSELKVFSRALLKLRADLLIGISRSQ